MSHTRLRSLPTNPIISYCIYICIILSIALGIKKYIPDYSLHLHQADAFAHGTTAITELAAAQAQQIDVVKYNNRLFVPNPPFPSILITPLVYLFGSTLTNLIWVSVVLSLFSFILLWRTCQQIGLSQIHTSWVCAAFFLGTGYWSLVLSAHETAYFAQIVATLCLLVGLHKVFGQKRAWLIGICISCSFLSRQFTGITGLLLLLELWRQQPSRPRSAQLQMLIMAGIPVAIAAMIYCLFNYVRFDNPFDTGYGKIQYYGWLEERIAARGVFSYSYIRTNLYYFFIQPPIINWSFYKGAWQLEPFDFGTALTFASPFLIFAFAAKKPTLPFFLLWWGVIGAVFIIELSYHDNGWRQINTHRYALDYIPLMFIPLIKFVKSASQSGGRMLRIWQLSVAWAVGLNIVFLVAAPVINSILRMG